MNRSFVFLGAASIGVAFVGASASCDSGPECGDGVVEGDEQCDDGNDVSNDGCSNACFLPAVETIDAAVLWTFNGQAAPGFDGDTCFDVGSERVEIRLSGPAERTGDVQCGFGRVSFLDVPAGTYGVEMRVLDSEGALLTNGPVTSELEVGDEDVEVTIDAPFESWRRDYTGTFFFRLMWSGMDCDAAKPAVVEHRLLLERNGRPLTSVLTDADDPVDGSGLGACRSVDTSIEQFPQTVFEIPFGPVEFEVAGYDENGQEAYRERFETFVGAGLGNPELVFDVGPLGGDDDGDGGDGDGDGDQN